MMDFEGTDKKYKVEATLEGFSQDSDDWQVTILNKYGRVIAHLPKQKMTRAEDGWYFMLNALPAGEYYAIFQARVPDDDFEDGFRDITDKQHLCSIPNGHCIPVTGKYCHCAGMNKLIVVYTATDKTFIRYPYAQLRDFYHTKIITSNGMSVKVKMTNI